MNAHRAITPLDLPESRGGTPDPAVVEGGAGARGIRRIRLHAETRALRAAAWAATYAGLLCYALLFRHTYVDDAYITLQYARNLAEHLTWGFHPNWTANTATSPLNVLLLALFDRITPGATVDAVAWLTAATWTLALACLLCLSRHFFGRPHFGLLAFVGLVTNPLLLSTIGLEGYLYVALMLLSLVAFVSGRWQLLGASLALLILSRPDGALLAVPLVVLMGGGLQARAKVAATFIATALPWYLFSWIHLGSIVPDSLIIKLNQTAWGETTFADGLWLYRDRYEAATAASLWPLVLVPFALLALWRTDGVARRAIGALVVSAVAHYAIYSAMGVPPYHWYYTHEIAAIVVVGALGATALLGGLTASSARPDRLAALAATALPAAGLTYLAWVAGWPTDSAPITTNWATPDQYQALGKELHDFVDPNAIIELHGEIGTVAYYCDCRVVDDFADPHRVDAQIADIRADASGLASLLLRTNFLWREPKDAIPPAVRTLEFDPIDRGEALPGPSSTELRSWLVSSPWISQTRITLNAPVLLTLEVRLSAPDGTLLPAEEQPTLSGDYVIFTAAGGPENGRIASGRWEGNIANAIPVLPHVDLVVRVSNPDYGTTDTVINIGGPGTVRFVAPLIASAQ